MRRLALLQEARLKSWQMNPLRLGCRMNEMAAAAAAAAV
jgi:hypothetical protein